MSFTSILQSDASATEKLTQLDTLVSAIRETYGNVDYAIEVPYINTPDGMVSLKYLDPASKVALAEQSVRTETIEAVEICEGTPGAVFDKEFEGLIATNPILCSLSAGTDSKYI